MDGDDSGVIGARINAEGIILLFYGLAIASGMEHVAELVRLRRNENLCMLICQSGSALLIGVADWVLYRLYAPRKGYWSVSFVFADMLFPILVFFMFWSAAGNYFLPLVALYFALSVLYAVVLSRALKSGAPDDPDRKVDAEEIARCSRVGVISAIFLVVSAGASFLILGQQLNPETFLPGAAAFSGAGYFLLVVHELHRTLARGRVPKRMA